MANTFAYNIVAAFIVAISFCIANVSVSASNNGFSIGLVHRDSFKSPYNKESETAFQRMTNAIRRSTERSNDLVKLLAIEESEGQIPVSTVVSNKGAYLMNISIGTPPFNIVAVADTGSDLIWTQCRPCTRCYKQVDPIFDPRRSPTYRKLPCSSKVCQGLSRVASCDNRRFCSYQYSYGDGSSTYGNIAIDTVSLGTTSGSLVSFQKTIIGCGYNNQGVFDSHMSGIVGLGGGSISLISQMGNATGGKFSYCLVPLLQTNTTSRLNFGANAQFSGPGVVTTPLVQKEQSQTFYYVTLEGISVGQTRIPTSIYMPVTKGNMIVDSGTTLTLLPPGLFDAVQREVAKQVNLKQVNDPEGMLSLCFNSNSDKDPLPAITMHFEGADLKLASKNTFLRTAEDVLCLGMSPHPRITILGNVAQMDFEVGYDIAKGMLSFRPTDCTKE